MTERFEEFRISDVEFDLFYDETNNIRKLLLVDAKNKNYLNTEDNPFILGGIVTPKGLDKTQEFQSSISTLFRNLGIQPNQTELKFKHIAKGDYHDIIRSKKLKLFFSWLDNNNIKIHFQIIDVLYWSIIDILESKTANNIFVQEYSQYAPNAPYLAHIKTMLYKIVSQNKDQFLKSLYEIGYPDINESKKQEFIKLILQFIRAYKKSTEAKENIEILNLTNCLEKVFIAFRTADDAFRFLKGEVENRLINSFCLFYSNRITSFPNSSHILDEEVEIMTEFNQPYWNQTLKNSSYVFIKSEESKAVQLSDILLGFLRSVYKYLTKTSFEFILLEFKRLPSNHKACLASFFTVYDKSIEADYRLSQYLGPMDTYEKFLFLKSLALTP